MTEDINPAVARTMNRMAERRGEPIPFPHVDTFYGDYERPKQPQEPQWSKFDIGAAIRDCLLLRMGERVKDPHPLAAQYRRNGEMTLQRAADETLVHMQGIDISDMIPRKRVEVASFSQADLPNVLVDVARNVVVPRVNEVVEKLRRFTYHYSVGDYREEGFSAIDATRVPDLVYGNEMRELPRIGVAHGEEKVQVASGSALLVIGRPVLVNDDYGFISATLRSIASQAGRKEAELCFGLFATNPNLSDGSPWFGAGTGNLLTTTALDPAGLSSAMEALRNQPTESGSLSDADPAYLVVNGADEQAALALNDDMGNPVTVVASAHVPAASWFLLADPMSNPTIARTTMAMANAEDEGQSIVFENARGADKLSVDGIVVRVHHAAGYSALSRVGIIRADK